MEFRDQRVMITGGASGIGAAIADAFLAAGAKVAVCDVDPRAVERFGRDRDGAIAMTADVSDETDMAGVFDELFQRWGGIDIVHANAGNGGPVGLIEDIDYDAWKRCLEINLSGAFLTCRLAACHLKQQGSGLLLLTASSAGLHGYPQRSAYAAVKWGIVGLTKTLAMELGPHGVRVNALAPGAVEGDRMDRIIELEAANRGVDEQGVRASYVEASSMRTWVSGEDVANAALFLASRRGAKISGQILSIDGHTEHL